jgi:hypothetical protein
VCFIGDGINDAIALRRADASVSLRGATTMATDAAQVVLMEDDLAQLDALWALSAGFMRSLDANERTAKAFSLSAALGVLAVPLALKFWLVEIGWFAQSLTGIGIATRRLDGGGARGSTAPEAPVGGSSIGVSRGGHRQDRADSGERAPQRPRASEANAGYAAS